LSENKLNKQSHLTDRTDISEFVDLFFNVDVLFCIAEKSGYFTLVNPHWTTVLGWSVDELMSRPFMDFVHPDDQIATEETAKNQFDDNLSVNKFVNRYRTKDGDYRWLEWTAQSPEGGVVYAVVHDITEEREREIELKLVQDRLQELVQNVPGAFFQYIVKQDGSHTMNYMSPGSKDIWGLTPEEIGTDPSPLWEMILPEDIAAVQESVLSSLKTDSRWQQEYRIKLPSGEIRWLRGVGKPRRMDTGDTFWNSLVMDLTELREQQNTIAKMQRMDMIGHLASGISHDFNNILAIIDGHRQLMALKTDDPELLEHINVMDAAIQRAQSLTKRLLLSSKKNAVPTGQVVSLTSSLNEIRRLLDEVTPSNIQVTWDIDPDCKTLIKSGEFDDVVTNLFINARNALDEDGRILVELKTVEKFNPELTTYVHLEPAPSMQYSVLTIEDNGCGIDEKEFEKIFIPFITSSQSGTGLGLAMVVGFASRNKCGVTLESTLGQGTRFSIWIPDESIDSQDIEEHEPNQPEGEQCYKIVLVDDEKQALEVVAEMLTMIGHQVTTFDDSHEAKGWLGEHYQDVDLVLTDEIMPGGVQGHDIYTEFNSKIPVIIMSGYLDTNNFDLGSAEILQKPVSLDTLQASIQHMMSS
jgi:PAS domain S-box-containing protein